MRGLIRKLLAGVPLRSVLCTFATGAAGGLLASLLHLPIPMLIGSLIAVAVVAATGRRVFGAAMDVPQQWRFVLIPVIGVAIGAGFTPDTLTQAALWWITLLGLLIYIPAAHATGFLVCRLLGRLDPKTAYYASIPGGLIESLQMGEEAGADVQMLTMLQFFRLILCILLVPLAFILVTGQAVGNGAGAVIARPDLPLTLQDAALLIVAAVAGAWLGHLLRLPAAIISGPILLSALVHVTGVTQAVPPDWTITLTQLVVGTSLGSRFAGFKSRSFWLAVRLSVLTSVLVLGLGLGAALLLSGPADMPVTAVFLAYAPGGISEMSLIALSLQVSAVYVTLHHVARILISVGLARVFAGWVLR